MKMTSGDAVENRGRAMQDMRSSILAAFIIVAPGWYLTASEANPPNSPMLWFLSGIAHSALVPGMLFASFCAVLFSPQGGHGIQFHWTIIPFSILFYSAILWLGLKVRRAGASNKS